MTPRTRRKAVEAAVHILIPASLLLLGTVAGLLGAAEAGGFMAIVGFLYIPVHRWLPFGRWAAQRFIRECRCVGCGWVVSLDDRWPCPCGFIQPRGRHLFEPCPVCGEKVAYAECPSCGSGILL